MFEGQQFQSMAVLNHAIAFSVHSPIPNSLQKLPLSVRAWNSTDLSPTESDGLFLWERVSLYQLLTGREIAHELAPYPALLPERTSQG
jgi:hypothetical protein